MKSCENKIEQFYKSYQKKDFTKMGTGHFCTSGNFCTEGHFCTASLLHERHFSSRGHFCTATFLHGDIFARSITF